MILLILISIALIGGAGWLVVRGLTLPRLRLDAHLSQIESYGFEEAAEPDLPTSRERRTEAYKRLAERLGREMMMRAPALRALRRGDLTAAGIYNVSPDVVHGYRLIAAVLTAVIGIGYVQVLAGGFSFVSLLVVAALPILGWQAPAMAIRARARDRLEKIDRELPELIDLLVATVEAGLGLGASLRLVAGRFTGPLGEELRLTVQQQGLGMSNEAALNDMVERVDTPGVRAFVRTVIRAETLGVSIGPIMRNLATDMRRRRRQAAREKVQKTPIKMLFPLVFLIFPSLFIVLLYPAVYTILHELGGGGA
jgi:tight adherence protein C